MIRIPCRERHSTNYEPPIQSTFLYFCLKVYYFITAITGEVHKVCIYLLGKFCKIHKKIKKQTNHPEMITVNMVLLMLFENTDNIDKYVNRKRKKEKA